MESLDNTKLHRRKVNNFFQLSTNNQLDMILVVELQDQDSNKFTQLQA